MAERTGIEWCDHTWSPWIGCTPVSPACDHCYAAAWVKRCGGDFSVPRLTSPDYWKQPLRWNRKVRAAGVRSKVFPSQCDPFDNQVPDAWRHGLWDLIQETQSLDWLLLTKRPQNIRKMLPAMWGNGWDNVWLGVTAENQTEADRRIPHLLAVPARVRFLSCEPLLGPIDLTAITQTVDPGFFGDCLRWYHKGHCHELDGIDYPTISWIIAGGESGPKARPTHPDWARSLRDQCAEAEVPFFWKQWGEWLPGAQYTDEHRAADPGEISRFACKDWEDGQAIEADAGAWGCDLSGDEVFRVGRRRAGVLLDGREHREVPHG